MTALTLFTTLPARRLAVLARLQMDASVKNEDCEEVDIVNSIDEVIPAIAAYYEANPPRWEFEPRPDFRHTDMKAVRPPLHEGVSIWTIHCVSDQVRPMGSISQ